MTFKEALVKYWKGNTPWYQIMLGVVTLFTVLLGVLGGVGVWAMWIIMGAVYAAILGGTFFNVKDLQRIYTQRDKIRDNKS